MQSLGVQKWCSANAFSDTKRVIFFASFYWLRDFLLENMELNFDHVHWNMWTNIKKFYARNNIFKKKNFKNEILNHLCFDTKFVILETALWRFNHCLFFFFKFFVVSQPWLPTFLNNLRFFLCKICLNRWHRHN